HFSVLDRWATDDPANALIARFVIQIPPPPSAAREPAATGPGILTRVHAVPFRCSRNGPPPSTQTLPGDTARRSPNCWPASALLLTWPQLRPLNRSRIPALPPTAQMSRGDRALADWMLPASPVTLVHVLPCRCQVPGSPKTQTSVGLNAMTPVSSSRSFHRLATDHLEPLECSTNRPGPPTAQTSLAAGALAAAIEPVSPDGSGTTCQLRPFQCSATGVPRAGPTTSVLPNAHALFLPVETTLSRVPYCGGR